MQDKLIQQYMDLEAGHWWWRARARILGEAVQRLLRQPDGRCIISVGSGPGYTQAALARYAETMIGIEPSDTLRQHAQRLLHLDVRPGSLPGEVPSGLPPADLVLLLDVLEHIDDDTEACREAGSLLKPGGRLIATVPACPWLWGPWDELNRHKRRYTKRDLVAVLERAGVGAERVSYFNVLLFPLMVSQRIGDRVARRRPTGRLIPPRPLNRLLESVFAAERVWLRRASFPWWGGSLLCVSRPRSEGP